MESEQIQADSDEPISSHKLFRGIMLSFLFFIITIGFVSAFGFQHITPQEPRQFQTGGVPEDRSQRVAEVKEILKIDEDIILPSDGIQYFFKKVGEGFREAFEFDKVEKELLNVELINERAKEIAVISAQGEPIPADVLKNYNDRINRASRFVELQTDANENIERRTEIRAAIQEHRDNVLNLVETQPSNTPLGRIISDFRQRVADIIMNIDEQEVAEVRNTLPIIREKQLLIKRAEMTGDVDEIRRLMDELAEIDEKLNRLHLAKLCSSPIKTLSLNTATDIVQLCPIAAVVEGEIQDEIDRIDRELLG